MSVPTPAGGGTAAADDGGTAAAAVSSAGGVGGDAADPGVLTRTLRFLTATPVVAGAVVAVLIAGGILAYPWFLAPFDGRSGSDAQPVIERTGEPDAPGGPPAGEATSGPPAEAVPVFTNAVPPMPTVMATAELGPIPQHPRVSARDNGQSVRYADRSVWIFADTRFRNPFGFLSNSGAVTTDLTAGDGITLTSTNPFTGDTAGDPVELIPRTETERQFEVAHSAAKKCLAADDPYCGVQFAFWPGAVAADPARGRILIFYHKLCRGGAAGTPCSGLLGKALGSGIAVLDMRSQRVARLAATGRATASSLEGPDPTIFFPPGTEFTAAALTVGQTAYVYGACTYLGCKVARVQLAEIGDRSAWTFFTGRDRAGTDRWSSDPGRSVNTVAAGAAGHTVLWNPALRCFMNVLLPYGINRAEFQVGGSPFGPWSRTRPLMDTAPGATGPNYALFAHTEYAERGGLVQYVSYYQPETGHQRLVRIMFEPGR
jgi:hypothetical protein